MFFIFRDPVANMPLSVCVPLKLFRDVGGSGQRGVQRALQLLPGQQVPTALHRGNGAGREPGISSLYPGSIASGIC